MTRSQLVAWLIALVALGAFGWAMTKDSPDPAPPKADTVYVKLTAKSDTVILRTTRTVTKLDTLLDTLPGDTVFVPKEVLREVIRDCLECAEQLRAHKTYCDSARKADANEIARLHARVAQLERRKWGYAAAGGLLSLVACR